MKLSAIMKALTALLPLTAAAPMVQKHNLTEPARRDFEPYDTIVFCEGELPLYPSHYVSLRGHPSCTGVQIIYDTCQLIPDSNRLGDDGSSFDINYQAGNMNTRAECALFTGNGCDGRHFTRSYHTVGRWNIKPRILRSYYCKSVVWHGDPLKMPPRDDGPYWEVGPDFHVKEIQNGTAEA